MRCVIADGLWVNRAGPQPWGGSEDGLQSPVESGERGPSTVVWQERAGDELADARGQSTRTVQRRDGRKRVKDEQVKITHHRARREEGRSWDC